MKKKIVLSAILVLSMLTSMMSGCSSKNEQPANSNATTTAPAANETKTDSTSETSNTTSDSAADVPEAGKVNEFGWEIPAETIVINAFDASGNYAPTEAEKQGIVNVGAYMKEKFNVEFNVARTAGDGEEEVNLRMASGDYPDVMYNLTYNTTQRLINLGKAVELTPYMDSALSNVKRSMGDMYPLFLNNEGKLFYVPIGMGALYELPDYSAHIRYDEWMAIGSPEIKTPDDYYNALKAVLEKFPTTPNGESRYAMSLYDQGDPENFAGYWGLKRGYKIESDDSFSYWAFTEEGKNMSKFFQRFYIDGTMDPDAFINKFDEWKAKFSAERVAGAIGGWWIGYNAGHEVWKSTDPNWTEEKRTVQIAFKAPEAEAANLTGKNEYGGRNTIITDKAKNIDAILKFIDWESTELGMALTAWGLPNGTPTDDPNVQVKAWNIDESGKWAIDPEAKTALINETWDYNREGYMMGIPIMFQNVSRWADGIHCIWYNQMWYDENKWKTIMMKNMEGTIYNASTMILRDKSEEIILIEQAIKDARKMYWPLVVQTKTPEEFENAWKVLQDALKAAGIDQYCATMSENYKNNLAKVNKAN